MSLVRWASASKRCGRKSLLGFYEPAGFFLLAVEPSLGVGHLVPYQAVKTDKKELPKMGELYHNPTSPHARRHTPIFI
jgi:hypothetical protein